MKEYRQSPAVEEALAIMVKSYTKLGLTDLATMRNACSNKASQQQSARPISGDIQ